MYLTAEEAAAEGKQLFTKKDGDFYVTEVRQAELSDYMSATGLVGDLRENMQQMSGDSSPLDSPEFVDNIGDLYVLVANALETYEQRHGIDMSAMLIKGARVTIHVAD